MIYAMSDLHGYPLDEVKRLLKKANFNNNDILYVLGDVIDRGSEGIKTLLWMMEQSNIYLILGNHEAMMLSCEFILDEVNDSFLSNLDAQKLSLLNTWQWNGASPTIKELTALPASKRKYIFEYLHDASLYQALTVGDGDFVLVHSGLGHFDNNKKLSEYTPEELLWTRTKMTQRYFDDIIVVFGHTPTLSYGEQYRGKIVKTDTWINIDVGAAKGCKPALLCLDTLEEYYMTEEKDNL